MKLIAYKSVFQGNIKVIARTDALELLKKNLQRTEMLIVAMQKIKMYSQNYQANQVNLQDYKAMKTVQDRELIQIEQSCGEHAMISLATAFETYYKELTQQLLADYPKYFVSKRTKYSSKINELIDSTSLLAYEAVEDFLNLSNRFRYYDFLEAYSIALLTDDEKKVIEYIYVCRNNYVHNAGRLDAKSNVQLLKTPSPFPNTVIGTEVKRLRTKLGKILLGWHKRAIDVVSAE